MHPPEEPVFSEVKLVTEAASSSGVCVFSGKVCRRTRRASLD